MPVDYKCSDAVKSYRTYYINDKYHRTDGPAQTKWYSNGYKKTENYYMNYELHRVGGPAHIEYNYNRSDYYSNIPQFSTTNYGAIGGGTPTPYRNCGCCGFDYSIYGNSGFIVITLNSQVTTARWDGTVFACTLTL
jgi:hypothetical protein